MSALSGTLHAVILTERGDSMRKLMSALLGALILASVVFPGGEPAKIKALLVTGCDVGVHKWRDTTPAWRKALEDSGKFEVFVCEDPQLLDSAAALKKYDLLVFNYFNADKSVLSPAAQENLLSFVRDGKGFVACHFTSAAYQDWNEYHKLCGRYWAMGKSGHGPRGKYAVKIAAKDNPITKGVSDFEADDELYAKLEGTGDINVLATADSDFSHKTEPLAFTLSYGKGRVYHHAFGHDPAAIQKPPEVTKLFVRGAEWAATGKVSE
jgi:uncharacterized protein